MHVYEWTTDSIVDDEQKRSNLVGSVLFKPADVEIFHAGISFSFPEWREDLMNETGKSPTL